MNTANQRAVKLPFQEYVSTLGKTRKSKLWAEIRLVTGKDKTTIWRWAHGRTRPDKSDRDNIAFCVYKFSENRLPGDALFPEDYPYKGTHARLNNVEFLTHPKERCRSAMKRECAPTWKKIKSLRMLCSRLLNWITPRHSRRCRRFTTRAKRMPPTSNTGAPTDSSAATSGCMIKYPIWTSSAGSTSRMLLVRWWGVQIL